MEPVVLHYLSGAVRKGVIGDFHPDSSRFHLYPAHAPLGAQPHEVRARELKAIYFVKTYAGNPHRRKSNEPAPGQWTTGRRVRVDFMDGEVMVGTTHGLHTGCHGFYVIPVDPQSNNDRCYVFASAVREIRLIPGAHETEGESPLKKAWMAAVSSIRAWIPTSHAS